MARWFPDIPWTIGIDFDDCLVQHKNWEDISTFILSPKAKEFCDKLHKIGVEFFLTTCRTENYLRDAKEFLIGQGLDYFYTQEYDVMSTTKGWILSNPKWKRISDEKELEIPFSNGGKPNCDWYIDDKAIGIPKIKNEIDWEKIYDIIINELKEVERVNPELNVMIDWEN